jgi:hypothetical protein
MLLNPYAQNTGNGTADALVKALTTHQPVPKAKSPGFVAVVNDGQTIVQLSGANQTIKPGDSLANKNGDVMGVAMGPPSADGKVEVILTPFIEHSQLAKPAVVSGYLSAGYGNQYPLPTLGQKIPPPTYEEKKLLDQKMEIAKKAMDKALSNPATQWQKSIQGPGAPNYADMYGSIKNKGQGQSESDSLKTMIGKWAKEIKDAKDKANPSNPFTVAGPQTNPVAQSPEAEQAKDETPVSTEEFHEQFKRRKRRIRQLDE